MFVKRRPWLRAAEGPGSGGSGEGTPPEARESQPGGEEGEKDYKALYEEVTKERDTWKGHARTWEDRAKENKSAAEKLKELEDAGKSDAEKLASRAEQLEQELAEERSEKNALKRKLIAAEEKLTPEDYEFLPDTDDEDVLRKFAKRLAASNGPGAEDPHQGRGGSTSSRDAIIERAKNLK